MRTYLKLLLWVDLRETGGSDHDYKDVALSMDAAGIYKAAEKHEDLGGTPDDLYVETYEMMAGLPTEADKCLSQLSYEEWLDSEEKKAA